MVAVTGRRRVGKTFLIRSVYNEKIDLEFTGVQNAPLQEQLDNFHFLLQQFSAKKLKSLKNWLTAFHHLITVLETKKTQSKKLILFFDELPWCMPNHLVLLSKETTPTRVCKLIC